MSLVLLYQAGNWSDVSFTINDNFSSPHTSITTGQCLSNSAYGPLSSWESELLGVADPQSVRQSQLPGSLKLYAVLVEVERILNSKPLGYASTDVADMDPITPNILLMGRRDASLPGEHSLWNGLHAPIFHRSVEHWVD